MFYHILFKDREICWQYGARVNYNLDMRVVDGTPQSLAEARVANLMLCRTGCHAESCVKTVMSDSQCSSSPPLGRPHCRQSRHHEDFRAGGNWCAAAPLPST